MIKMTQSNDLYAFCGTLFANYALACSPDGDAGSSMILMLRKENSPKFFILCLDGSGGGVSYTLRPWRAAGVVKIGPEGTATVPMAAAKALISGVPVPRHGSLMGWRNEEAISAVMAVYTEYEPSLPRPGWALMPRAEAPEAEWPPFTGEPFFGEWFWEYYQAGNLIYLGDLIATSPDTVFWAHTEEVLGSSSCVVAADVRSDDGSYVLRQGRYVYYRVLRAGIRVPPLSSLLADSSKIDLAPRFRLD